MDTVERVPVPVETLAEHETTNAYLSGSILVDPAARTDDLDAAVERRDPDHVVVTHAHPDHVGAVAEYADGRTVWALAGWSDCFERATGVAPDRTFRDGHVLPGGDGDHAGDDPAGGAARVIATPGHAPDHVALELGDGVLTGDLVVATGSVVVGAEEGDMRAYLTSLRRLSARDPSRLYPGHGPVVEDPREEVGRLLARRLERERRIEAAVGAGARTPDEIVDVAYDRDLAGVREFARSTVVAHLRKLDVEGRVHWDGARADPA
jgi:glyoxylase-like metal-dependent hydrolase (beta-lactamase superfamily II)